jgi:hypothetical protein
MLYMLLGMVGVVPQPALIEVPEFSPASPDPLAAEVLEPLALPLDVELLMLDPLVPVLPLEVELPTDPVLLMLPLVLDPAVLDPAVLDPAVLDPAVLILPPEPPLPPDPAVLELLPRPPPLPDWGVLVLPHPGVATASPRGSPVGSGAGAVACRLPLAVSTVSGFVPV